MLRIEEILNKKNITIVELAKRLNVSRQTVYYYINQDDKNPLNQLMKIANAIGVDVKDLLPADDEFSAFIEYRGKLKKFTSISDLQNYLNQINGRKNLKSGK